MAIILTGSVAYDYLMSFPGYFKEQIIPEKLDSISLSFLVDVMIKQRGGVAPNIAYTLALLGEKPKLMATVGEDFEDYRKWLEVCGIDTAMVKIVDGKFTASFFVNTDLSNNQIATFYTGAMADAASLSLADFSKGEADYVVISPNDPGAMKKYVEECLDLKIPYLYDPGQQVARNDHDDLCRGAEEAQALFVNEYEFDLLQKHTCLNQQQMVDRIPLVVVTLGEKGAVIYNEGKKYEIGIVPPGKILDPTGVGDAFRGGFLRGYRSGFDLQTCGQMGALAATYCLEQKGTQNHVYSIPEFIARYRQNFDDQGMLEQLIAK
ncbi:MAG: carbohydrate kinase family protein [Anaerolineaceae bacterium]